MREIRRCIRVVGDFPDGEPALGVVAATLLALHEPPAGLLIVRSCEVIAAVAVPPQSLASHRIGEGFAEDGCFFG